LVAEVLSAFLNWFLSDVVPPPHAVVAAGHAASYALYQAVYRPGTINRLVLIAPTWRGPLPTMMGGQRPWFARIRAAVDLPGLGPLLDRLNVSKLVVARMAREHVYDDRSWLSGDSLAAKLAVTRAPGARHASVRFVSGGLDRVESRAAFLDLAQRVNVPILVVFGDQTPARSCAEIEALADLPNVHAKRLTEGKLAIHEEFTEAVCRTRDTVPGCMTVGDS
jgi:pimeloyl-ACP methyl ester carboxylesterase